MKTLAVSYLHAESGAPIRALLGLTVVARAALYAQKAGADALRILVREADVDAVQATLSAEHRLKIDWSVTPDAASVATATATALGDRIHQPDALKLVLGGQPGDGLAHDGGAMTGWATPTQLAEGKLPDGALQTPKPSWVWLRTEADRDGAERMLIRSLTKDADGVVSRNINRKISGAISRRLASKAISPNHVTAVVAVLGLASGPFAAQGSYLGFAIAGLLYYISAILDGVDGELSRLKFLGSPMGAWLDTITDDAVCTSFLIGLYVGLARSTGLSQWHWIGLVTVGCFLLTVVPRYYLLIKAGGGGNHQILQGSSDGEKSAFGKVVDIVGATFFRTDFLPFFAAVTCLAAQPAFFGYSFAVGSVMAMIDTGVTVARFNPQQIGS